MTADDGFLSRWARRKNQIRQGLPVEDVPVELAPSAAPEPAPVALQTAAVPVPLAKPPEPVLPLPTLDDVAALGADANYTRFVASGVDENVKRAALKKLFAEPQFNVMDGLDIYTGDYTQADPMPAGMLDKLSAVYAMLDPVKPPPDGRVAPGGTATVAGDAAGVAPVSPADAVAEDAPAPEPAADRPDKSA